MSQWHMLCRNSAHQHLSTALSADFGVPSLRQPDLFLDKPGPITEPWKTWVTQFENYLIASGGTDYPVAGKKALLLHCFGKEGQRVFQNLPDHDNPPAGASEYDKALLVLEKQINVVAERYKFRQRA